MNILDIGIILISISFLIMGFRNGAIKELVSVVGIIIVFIMSYVLKGIVGNFLCTFLPFIKFTGAIEGLVTLNIFLYQAIAFLVLFSLLLGIYMILVKISKFLQKIVNLTIILIIPSKIIGTAIAFCEGILILFVVLVVLMVPLKEQPIFKESSLASRIVYKTPILSTATSNFTGAVSEVYELTTRVSKKEISTNDANLKALDVMLKYKIVNKQGIENLIKLKKLEDIKNIESVLENY